MAPEEPLRAPAVRSRAARLVVVCVVGLNCIALLFAATPSSAARRPAGHTKGTSLAADEWPASGQAAYAIGTGAPAASPGEQPVPIASLAKVMTAYLTLTRYPLAGAADGFTVTVTPDQVQAVAAEAAEGESVVAVQNGEVLTERQLLEALLIPSGNNVAGMLATVVAGSAAHFVSEMNAEAGALGMKDTVYTDPSGFDPGTVSTAADQLRLFEKAMRIPAFRQVVSMPTATLPVAGTVRNFDPLIAQGYVGKTGSDAAAEGCLAFLTHATVGGRGLGVIGVVLGQGMGSDTSALLSAAGETAERLVHTAAQAATAREAAAQAKRHRKPGAAKQRGGKRKAPAPAPRP